MALFDRTSKSESAKNNPNAASLYRPTGSGGVDVINDYTWTLTPPQSRKEIPSIILTEYEVDETTIARQVDFYVNGIGSAIQGGDILSPYDSLFPKDKDTGFWYFFPFYTDVNFEVNTPQWASLDTLEAGKKAVADIGSIIHPAIGGLAEKTMSLLGAGTGAVLAANYPKVGIMDRPKLWESHDFRSYTIKFPLYNTYNSDSKTQEWIKNRELCELLVNQNLYNKLTFITGIPPVFYEVLIPGQHYSPAACVTNLTIYNRGNIRQLQGPSGPCNVPDVYEVNITLTDLVIPSKNLFQAINNESVRSTSKIRNAQQTYLEKTGEATTSIASSIANSNAAQGAAAGGAIAGPLGASVGSTLGLGADILGIDLFPNNQTTP
jgi:hypothetical protein